MAPDERTMDDSADSEEHQSAQPEAPEEAPVDVTYSTSSPESPTPASSSGEPRTVGAEEDTPSSESKGIAEADAGHGDTDSKPRKFSDKLRETMLAQERRKDAAANIDTRPPDGEIVRFRSVTVAEIYAGQAIDSLTTALAAIELKGRDEPVLARIAEARRGFQYSWGRIWLFPKVPFPGGFTPGFYGGGYGRTNLPAGVDRISCKYSVFGPSIVAVVLTFVLSDDEAKKIDAALREDAESRPDLRGPGALAVETVADVKRERVRNIQEEVAGRCRAWLKERMPGTLSATPERPGLPTCALVSLADGKPFDTQTRYMDLLGLTRWDLAEKFVSSPSVFLVHQIGRAADGGMVAAFNEGAVYAGYNAEIFHETISSLMTIEGLKAVLLSFEQRLRDVRADLNQLDYDRAVGSEVIALRNRLLGISRDLSVVRSDMTVLVDDAYTIWADFSSLVRATPDGMPASATTTAETERRQLRTSMESLQAQEVGLRELILVTSQAASETRNLELQTQVLGLTKRLGGLTWALIVLTVVLVILGVITLVVQVVNTPTPNPASMIWVPAITPPASTQNVASAPIYASSRPSAKPSPSSPPPEHPDP